VLKLNSSITMRLRVVSCALLLAAASGCSPFFMSRKTVVVTGEFLPGERCSALTPRGPFVPSQRAGRTSYDFGGAYNVAPPGYVVHTIWCRVDTPSDSLRFSSGRWLQVSISVPGGQSVPAGRYAITDFGVEDSTTFTASVSLELPEYNVGTKGSGFGFAANHIFLEGVSGELELTRIDPPGIPESGTTEVPHPQVVGRFTMRARREWSM